MADLLKSAASAMLVTARSLFDDDTPTNGRRSGMCDFCGKNPKNSGFNYCSKRCGLDAQKQASASASSGGRRGHGRQTASARASSAEIGHCNLCERCHKRPKRQMTDHRGAKTMSPYCSRTCANEARTLSHCRLKECNKTTNGDPYCSDGHAKKAVRNSEVAACPACREMPVNPGFTFCSRQCAIGPGGAGGGASSSGGAAGLNPPAVPNKGPPGAYEVGSATDGGPTESAERDELNLRAEERQEQSQEAATGNTTAEFPTIWQ